MGNRYFRLYSTSKAVRGKKRAAFYLLDEERIEIVPLSMVDVVDLLAGQSIDECKNHVDSTEVLDEYIAFLTDKRIGFITDEPERFPGLDDYFDVPSHIFLSCIEIDEESTYDLQEYVKELDRLLCKHVELRILHDNMRPDQLVNILNTFDGTTIRSIHVYMRRFNPDRLKDLTAIIEQHKKVSTIKLFSMDENRAIGDIIFTDQSFEEAVSAPVKEDQLFINIRFFTQSKKFNTFYHKKVAITHGGEIKNNLGSSQSFGTYCPTSNTIADIMERKDFRKYWDVGPDLIEDLKDSELRYAIFPAYELEESDGKYFFKKD